MNCISFPKIFKGNSTSVQTGIEATKTCVHLTLSSERGELFGDPEFGIRLKRYIYNQNSYILRDVIIDEIFEQLRLFHPQLIVQRNDIKIVQNTTQLIATIKCINKVDYTTNMFNIVLLDEGER